MSVFIETEVSENIFWKSERWGRYSNCGCIGYEYVVCWKLLLFWSWWQ